MKTLLWLDVMEMAGIASVGSDDKKHKGGYKKG